MSRGGAKTLTCTATLFPLFEHNVLSRLFLFLLLLLRWVGGLGIISGLHALPVPLVGGFLIVQDAPLADKVSWADVADKGGILAVVAAVLSALTTCKAAAATAVAGTLLVGMAHLDLSHPPYSNLWWVSLAGAACRVAGMSQSDCDSQSSDWTVQHTQRLACLELWGSFQLQLQRQGLLKKRNTTESCINGRFPDPPSPPHCSHSFRVMVLVWRILDARAAATRASRAVTRSIVRDAIAR